MKIALLGATSFIGRSVLSAIIANGDTVVAFSRQPELVQRWFPNVESFYCDFTEPPSVSFWKEHLKSIEVIINCVGVFQTRHEKEMWQIHLHTPEVIYQAAVELSIPKIIHISALGIDKIDAGYATSKLAIEDYLKELNIDSVILRPSYVYGAGSYGGSSFLRGMAGLPGFLMVPGSGQQQLQPVHIDDLCAIIVKSLSLSGKHQLDVVGDEKISLKKLLNKMRAWLGFGKAINIPLPMVFLNLGAKIGDFFRNSPIGTTGVKVLSIDNVSTPENYEKLISMSGFKPRSFTDALLRMPSQVQDRWHARLFFLRPLLRMSIAFIWIFTAIVTLFIYPHEQSIALLVKCGISQGLAPMMLYAFGIVDFALGLATLMNYKIKWVGFFQCILMLAYTLIITLKMPYYWIHPFGPISKNIPLLAATAIMMALESSR